MANHNGSLSVIFSRKFQLLSELSVQLTMMSVCLCFVDVSVSLLMKTFNQLSVCLTFLMSNIAVTTQLNKLCHDYDPEEKC